MCYNKLIASIINWSFFKIPIVGTLSCHSPQTILNLYHPSQALPFLSFCGCTCFLEIEIDLAIMDTLCVWCPSKGGSRDLGDKHFLKRDDQELTVAHTNLVCETLTCEDVRKCLTARDFPKAIEAWETPSRRGSRDHRGSYMSR